MLQASFTINKDGHPLGYTDVQKLHCGLRWDPVEDSTGHADLDLIYATYDEFGRFISVISGKDGIKNNAAGSIYHSGDDEDGVDSHDDERVTLDLFAIPQSIHHIFLGVELQSEHTFGNIINPSIRLSKGVDTRDMLNITLDSKPGANARSFIFIRLDRNPSGWTLHVINEYPEGHSVPEWERVLIDHMPDKAGLEEKRANMPITPKQNEHAPLYYTKQAMHRIVCGLSWDERGEKQTFSDKINERKGVNTSTFDLDLTCLMYDADGEYYDYVTSLAEHAVDESGAVYHSGDDTSGVGAGDDEQIFVELANLPEDIHHVVFVVDMKSDHTLGEIYNPQIRLFDGMSGRVQLDVTFDQGGNNNAYIFARVKRTPDGWVLHNITRYINTAGIEDWGQALAPYLN